MTNCIPDFEWDILRPLDGVRTMLELGNKKNPGGTYKAFIESIGIDHTSVDWNGQDGALKMDLRRPLGLGQFDCVTNFGTTEHCGNTWDEQLAVWKNVHNACRVGGLIVNATPYWDERSWWWHGVWQPREDFFEHLAARCGYEIERMCILRQAPHELLGVRLRKVRDLPWIAPRRSTIRENVVRPRHTKPLLEK